MADLTEAEAAVYDRQLRVWGVEVQKRLREARVLIIGCTGLAAEVAKNIVLAGVGVLHLMDDTPSTQGAASNFLNTPADPSSSVASVCAKSLTEMNPMVSVAARAGPVAPSRDIVHDYDLVLIVGRPFGSLVLWDTLCRDNGVAFFAAVSRGMQAFFFTDLGQHTFQPPDREGKAQEIQSKQYPTLVEALQQSWKSINPSKTHKLMPVILLCATKEGDVGGFLRPEHTADLMAFGQNLAKTQAASAKVLDRDTLEAYLSSSEELAPVNAIVGGVLANEVLKAMSKKGEPFDNLFLYSMADGGGMIEKIAPAVTESPAPLVKEANKPVMSALASKVEGKSGL